MSTVHPEALKNRVVGIAQRLKKGDVRIVVLGDMILDHSIEGVPGGYHPETRVPVLKEATEQESVGGAANIALALARLGVQVTLFGIIGSDLPGRQMESMLERQAFPSYLVTPRGWPTPRKDWIYRREGSTVQLMQRIDYDRPLSSEARQELVGEFRARCPSDAQVLILADHGLGSMGQESLPIIGLARQRGMTIVAIPRTLVLRGQPLDALVLDAPEVRRLLDAPADAEPKALAMRWARETGQHVYLSLLEEGLYVCPGGLRSGAGTLVPGYPLDNPQWMGARDITTALVGIGLALGLEPVETGRVANVFRHLVACQRGNGRVLWQDVFQFLGIVTPV